MNREVNKDTNKFTWSKLIIIFTGAIFLACIIFVMYMYIAGRIDSTYDTAAIITCITVSGSIFGSNLCWYSKKAASENQYKLRMGLYADAAKIRLDFNESMMKLMQEYGITEDDVSKIDDSGEIDEMMGEAIDDAKSSLDAARDEADSPNEIQQFN